MKRLLLSTALVAFGIHSIIAQNAGTQVQRNVTDPQTGFRMEFMPGTGTPAEKTFYSEQDVLSPGINWQATDGAAIANVAKVSGVSLNTATGWGLNDQRLSLYESSSIPVWEVPCPITAWDESVDMTEDGTWIVNGYTLGP